MGPGPGTTNSEVRTKVCPQCKTRYDADLKICPRDGTILVFEAASELSPGSIVAEKYKIVELIGRGASGSVYKALQAGLNREVAIKVLKLDYVSDRESLQRFELEAKASAKLTHINICAVYDHGVLPNGQPYMVCELLKGKTLRDVLKRHKQIAPEEAVEICTQICDALAVAHDRGIVHRDIKPANVMLCVDEQGLAVVKLIDFGMAKILRGTKGNTETLGLTKTGDILGTPWYMSPEQALGQKIDWRADIYSLGCVLFEMVSGSVPFHGASEYEVIDKHVHGMVPALPQHIPVPEHIPAVIKKSLAKTADLRFSSAMEMKDALLAREASAASRAQGSMLRSMSAAKAVGKEVGKGGIQYLIPILILGVLAVMGWYLFSWYQSYLDNHRPAPQAATQGAAAPHWVQPPANPHELPHYLEPITSMPQINDQIRYLEDYARGKPFDYGVEHELVMLYSNFDARRSAQRVDLILQNTFNEPHILAHLVGGEKSPSPVVAKVYLAKLIKDHQELPFLRAACLIKLGDICKDAGQSKEAAKYFAEAAQLKSENAALARYTQLASDRLKQLPADAQPSAPTPAPAAAPEAAAPQPSPEAAAPQPAPTPTTAPATPAEPQPETKGAAS